MLSPAAAHRAHTVWPRAVEIRGFSLSYRKDIYMRCASMLILVVSLNGCAFMGPYHTDDSFAVVDTVSASAVGVVALTMGACNQSNASPDSGWTAATVVVGSIAVLYLASAIFGFARPDSMRGVYIATSEPPRPAQYNAQEQEGLNSAAVAKYQQFIQEEQEEQEELRRQKQLTEINAREKSKEDEYAEAYIQGEINEVSLSNFNLGISVKTPTKGYVVRISSPGGEVDIAYKMIEELRGRDNFCVATGIVASAAATIFESDACTHRVARATAVFLFHSVTTGGIQGSLERTINQAQIDMINKRATVDVSNCFNVGIECYYTPQQALAAGLIDGIE